MAKKTNLFNYISLDIENPNVRGNSICAIGICYFENGQLKDKFYTLINPEDRFDRTNSEITGITESMVLDSPTLIEIWPELEQLLTNNIIVGHNITYDLSVLSKSLERYDITAPEFSYICTLELSRDLLNAKSYSLPSLMAALDVSYNAHNALEDAYAAHILFDYLIGIADASEVVVFSYQYEHTTRDTIDEKLTSNINDLHGILAGITSDGIVDAKEIALLQQWLNDNSKNKIYSLFDRIIADLTSIIEDGIVTEYERIKLTTMVDCINHSNIYTDSTLSIQILEGILKGIVCNQIILDSEVAMLNSWLHDNDYLKGVYPYDKVVNAIEKILADGIITEDEKEYLITEFDEILNPISSCDSLDLQDKTFCLTGDFKSGSKAEIEAKLTAKGGIKKSGVSGKLDYLFVGGCGSEAWKYGNTGGKIAKAQELQEKGKNIKIISEDDLMACL